MLFQNFTQSDRNLTGEVMSSTFQEYCLLGNLIFIASIYHDILVLEESLLVCLCGKMVRGQVHIHFVTLIGNLPIVGGWVKVHAVKSVTF